MQSFKDLGLIPEILSALEVQGYSTPTPIQAQTIPIILEGKDIIACAQTGTGKTAAFALPVLQLLNEVVKNDTGTPKIKCLILTPTRELAVQIEENFKLYGQHLKMYSSVIFGGVNQKGQADELNKGVDVLIATPGRLLDLMKQGIVNLGHLQILILDEADRMLDMGFITDVRRIISKVPKKRQTLLFSATMPAEIRTLAQEILDHPERVEVTPISSTADTIQQSLYYVTKANKKNLLIDILSGKEGNLDIKTALIFTKTKHGADKLTKDLTAAGISARAIHGNKSQNARQLALNSFKEGSLRVLIATDIAARGIDIDELQHVINYELPNIPETYVHRIGRTGRAGNSGSSISFCDSEEMFDLRDIEKLIKKSIPVISGHGYPMSKEDMIPRKPAPKVQQQRSPRKDAPKQGSVPNGFRAPKGSSGNSNAKPGVNSSFSKKPSFGGGSSPKGNNYNANSKGKRG
jgi:ATP-dependent RNA helicase RhlE